jgi:transposase
MQVGIADLEAALATELGRHPTAGLLRSVPGLGPVLAARVLAEIGDDTTRFASITKSTDARAHYDQRRATDDSHNAALRSLAPPTTTKQTPA